MVATSGCEVITPSLMEQEISAAEGELAALVARYLEKRGLKKTLTRFLKEAELVDRLENSKEDLEAIYTSYMSRIKSAPCKRKEAKKDLQEPLQKKVKLLARINSVDNGSVADETDAENRGEVDSVEVDLGVQTMPGKIKSLLAVNSDTVTQEPGKLKKKSRRAKGPVTGRTFGDNDLAPEDEHACSGEHLEGPRCGTEASTKSEFSDKKRGSLVKEKKHKSAEWVKGMDLSTEKRAVQFSSDDDSIFKKQQLHAEKPLSSLKVPLSSSKSLNVIATLDSALDSSALLENGKAFTSKKKRKLDSDAGKSGIVDAKSFDGNHSERPLVMAKLENGSEDGIRKLKQPEANGVRAFQRVKLEEVTFADPRLQNNSYWAKDGAEIGWGAKAEEVLGQVKGRDFRHEKTKKKRGSYKGGAIDLHSRSIKFSYSDEE